MSTSVSKTFFLYSKTFFLYFKTFYEYVILRRLIHKLCLIDGFLKYGGFHHFLLKSTCIGYYDYASFFFLFIIIFSRFLSLSLIINFQTNFIPEILLDLLCLFKSTHLIVYWSRICT